MKEKLWQKICHVSPMMKDHLLYATFAGSRSYGTSTSSSDIDVRGIAFAPRRTIFGLSTYEQTIIDDPDTVIYSLRKYFDLALKGNPNILELLYVEPTDVIFIDTYGTILREHRELFLSQKVFHAFGGYAIKNMRKLAQRDESSYDAKDASHLIRLLQMGTELLLTKSMRVRRPNAPELLSIKRGEWKLVDVLDYAERLYEEMTSAHDHTTLPPQPDQSAAERLLIQMHESFYLEQKRQN